MGWYDGYFLTHEITCPNCGSELETWQGKDGPCHLLKYNQGGDMPTSGIDKVPVEPLEDPL